MTRRRNLPAGAWLALGAFASTAPSACALTQRGESITWQYFTPEPARAPELTGAPVVGSLAARPQVCLERVSAGTGLGKRIAYRESAHQIGYYEDRRWTEEPARYVRRALERALYQESGFQCDRDAHAPTLDVEVLGFEELTPPSVHGARVDLRGVLRTSDGVLLVDQDVQAVDDVIGASFDDVVAAFGRALDKASRDLARRTGSALATEARAKRGT